MKILYGINGTGQGHVIRSEQIIDTLKREHQVDILLSGQGNPINLKHPIKYNFQGLTFILKKGKVDWIKTFWQNSIRQLLNDITMLDLSEYDLIISDFEPITSWKALFKRKPCVQFSRQASFNFSETPRPFFKNRLAELFMKLYCPSKCKIGVHYQAYNNSMVPPMIRQEIVEAKVENKGHITVYLSAYSLKQLRKVFIKIPSIEFQVFSPQCSKQYKDENIEFFPVSKEVFLNSLISCAGVICGAGFGLPAECLYLQKKLFAIPIKNQYEQECNGVALSRLGATVRNNLNHFAVSLWVESNFKPESLNRSTPQEVAKKIIKLYEDQLS